MSLTAMLFCVTLTLKIQPEIAIQWNSYEFTWFLQQLALACYGSSINAEDLNNEWAGTEWLRLLLR